MLAILDQRAENEPATSQIFRFQARSLAVAVQIDTKNASIADSAYERSDLIEKVQRRFRRGWNSR